jgi:hypothetical protein
MTVDDEHAHAAARELVGKHQAGRARSYDQYFGVHGAAW